VETRAVTLSHQTCDALLTADWSKSRTGLAS